MTNDTLERQKTALDGDQLDSRLGNWGRWSRLQMRGPRAAFNSTPPDAADAEIIEKAVSRMDGQREAALLRSWHQALAHKSTISARIGIPRRALAALYRSARESLRVRLAELEQPQTKGQRVVDWEGWVKSSEGNHRTPAAQPNPHQREIHGGLPRRW